MPAKKILLMGLDNSGKTSILLARKGTNLLAVQPLKPTKRLKIDNFTVHGREYSIWDFGGQMRYIPIYMRRFDHYVDDADELHFVIDIQDEARFHVAMEYLAAIVERLEGRAHVPPLRILLHKYDREFHEREKTRHYATTRHLLRDLRATIPEDLPHEIARTTIQTTLVQAALPDLT